MSFTKFDICTTASYLVGGEDIASFDEDTRESRIASRIYETTKRQLLQMHPWSFARKRQDLVKTTNTPSDYAYEYQIPTDCLRVLKKDTPVNNYIIVGDKLYTDSNTVELSYLYDVAEVDLPDYFVRALEYCLAEILAAALAQDESMVQLMNGLKDGAYRTAKLIDSQMSPPSSPHDGTFSLTEVR